MRTSVVIVLQVWIAVGFPQTSEVRGDDSLHAVIDQHLRPVSGLVPARCADAEFLRRVSLDLCGMPPTADEARAFLADTAAHKRDQVVEKLLASPQHARHFASALDLMLMERRANTHVTADEWQAWLLKSVRENKPWNVLVREILVADGDDPNQRPAARFMLDRASEPNLLTHDISRIFFGRDMQCAQCHDHPIVADYLQSDYHGLLAYVAPGYAMVRKEGDKQITLQAERAGSDLSFESVFVKGTQHRTGARMPDDTAVDEPFFLPGDEYQVAPADNVKSVPKFSRRAKLAELATQGGNQAFNQNIANRLWAHMFGRGLVHPLDLHHPDNAATDPELLEILGIRFAAMNYNMQSFLREIAVSETYQRAFDLPSDLASVAELATPHLAEIKQQLPQREQAAKESAAVYRKALEVWHQTEAATLPAAGELDAARNVFSAAKKLVDEAHKALDDVIAQQQTKQKIAALLQEAAMATQQAAVKLPDDQLLPDTAQKLVTKSAQLTTEATALVTTIAEKTNVLKPLTEALDAAKPPIDAAVTKLAPLKAAMLQAEQAMLPMRRKAATDSQMLAALGQQIHTTQSLAQLLERNQAIMVATALAQARATELAVAQQQLSEYANIVTQHAANVKIAAESRATATTEASVAIAEQTRENDLANAIAAALASAESALQKAGDDVELAEVVIRLKARVTVAQAAVDAAASLVNAAATTMSSATELLAAAQKSSDESSTEQMRRQQLITEATNAMSTAQIDLAAKLADMHLSVSELENRLINNFTTASLKPLTPEQLCWSVFRVTGVYDRYWQAEVTELDKVSPLTEAQKQDAAVVANRNVELEQKTYEKLKSNIGTFVTFYGAAAGQPQGDFFSTADQALFAANSGSLNGWVVPASDNVTERIIKQPDSRLAAHELYVGILTRMPTEDEVGEVTSYLNSRVADRNLAAEELVWAILNSAEFRFNH